jgi:hypothetical protein
VKIRASKLRTYVALGHVFGFREIDLRQGDDCAPDSEIGKNLQVFFGLRHPTVVGGDDEEREVNRANARDHILDEVLVPRDIHDTDVHARFRGL